MRSTIKVTFHNSCFPENVRRALAASLRARQINHQFLYDGVKQSQKWLALQEACSPARADPDFAATYEAAFDESAKMIAAPRVHVIGLGCGGGQKDAQLLCRLKREERRVSYSPCDISVALVLVATQTAATVIGDERCAPLVCDIMTADDLPAVFDEQISPDSRRLVTFFGMIPNFEPHAILPRLARIIRPHDWLLLSANLAPGTGYAAGVRHVLPQYDNQFARDWLMSFLKDLKVESSDGELQITTQDCPAGTGLKRIVATFQFHQPRTIRAAGEQFEFRAEETMCLFFSYRHTPDQIRALLAQQGITVRRQWITHSKEEGVFLCRRA